MGIERVFLSDDAATALGYLPPGLPPQQHAWNATLARDGANPVVPREL